MWIPKRFTMQPTSVRDWLTLLSELGERVVEELRTENPYGRFPR